MREILNRRGAATTEKLVVLLGVIVLVVGAYALFGDFLYQKYASVVVALGGNTPVETLATREAEGSGPNIIWVILFVAASLAFSIFVAGPALLPKLRLKRQATVNTMADRIPVLEPFADRSQEFEVQMKDLRKLAAEVKAQPTPVEGPITTDRRHKAYHLEQTMVDGVRPLDPDATIGAQIDLPTIAPLTSDDSATISRPKTNPAVDLGWAATPMSADDSATINREDKAPLFLDPPEPVHSVNWHELPTGPRSDEIPTAPLSDDIPTIPDDSAVFSSVPLDEFRKQADQDPDSISKTIVRSKLSRKKLK